MNNAYLEVTMNPNKFIPIFITGLITGVMIMTYIQNRPKRLKLIKETYNSELQKEIENLKKQLISEYKMQNRLKI